ncbi:MAG TPA: non-homologous end-joining DNA ligase [Nocardioidaceae bacterium]|nr:non-homologous end-joining DNA ligase [Nocardioidaceae bacterium]
MTRPARILPMLATAGRIPESDGWAFEFKWDGVRAVTHLHRGSAAVITRNDRDVASTYPELASLSDALGGRSAVLDGEIVALDPNGRPSFGELQSRMHVTQPSAELLRRVPVGYYLFDVLHLDGESLLRTPYSQRRSRLDELGLAGRVAQVPPSFDDADGHDLMAVAAERGFEGVVAKRRESIYEPGRRSRSWVKVPLINTQEVVIGGWKEGEGRRAGTIGSLLLGAYDTAHDQGRGQDGLRYVGHVGTGFSADVLADLQKRLRPLQQGQSPFADTVPRDRARGAHWVQAELVGEVEFRQWTRDGRLRHASWRGLRSDKSPDEVSRPNGR